MKLTNKQTALTVAFIALAGSAQAQVQVQPTVTIYGLVDVNLSNYAPGDNSGAANKTVMNDGVVNGLNGSRFGIRTRNEVANGVAVGVVLEAGFSTDTGSSGQGGRLFGRQGFVSVGSPSAGEVRLGRQYVLSDSVLGQGDPFVNALVNNPTTPVTNLTNKGLTYFLNPSRSDNVLQYETPNWGGFTSALQYAPGEGTSDDYQGIRFAYAPSQLYVGLAYEWNKDRSTGNSTNKALSIAANYNFGSFKLLAGYQNSTDLTATSLNGTASSLTVANNSLLVTGPSGAFTLKNFTGYTVGAEIPVSAATVLGVNYTVMNYEGTLGQTTNLGKIALSARYELMKNTYLYAGVSSATGDLREYISEKTVVQFGVRTAF